MRLASASASSGQDAPRLVESVRTASSGSNGSQSTGDVLIALDIASALGLVLVDNPTSIVGVSGTVTSISSAGATNVAGVEGDITEVTITGDNNRVLAGV